MGKKLAVILTGLGVFVLGVALLARFYAYDRLAVVPLDQDTVSVSEGPGATIFDIASQQEVTVDLVSTRNVVGDVEASEKASDELGRDIAVWETLVYTDEPGAEVSSDSPPKSGTHDLVAFDRHTGETVQCCDTYTSHDRRRPRGRGEGHDRLRGPLLQVPVPDREEDLPLLGRLAARGSGDRVQGGRDHRGPRGLPLEQVIPPTTVGKIIAPASFFDIDEEGDVTLDRVYSNTRTLWIEPETGVIVRGQEDQLSVAEYEGEQVATLTDVTIGYNPETISDNVDTYSALSTQLKLIRIWVPIVGGILGLLLLIAGLVMLRSSRRSEAHPPPDPG